MPSPACATPVFAPGDAPVEDQLHVVDRQYLAVSSLRLGEPPPFPSQLGPHLQRAGVLRIQLESPLQRVLGLFEAPCLDQRPTEGHVGGGGIGPLLPGDTVRR